MEIPLNKYNSSKADICFGFNIGKNKDNLGGMLGKCGIAVKHLWKYKNQTNRKLKNIKKQKNMLISIAKKSSQYKEFHKITKKVKVTKTTKKRNKY